MTPPHQIISLLPDLFFQINQVSINHLPSTINQLLQGMEEAIEWYIESIGERES